MDSDKPFWRSKTLAGILLLLVPTLLKWFGIELDDAGAQEIVSNLVIIIGAVIAIVGRLTAKRTLTASPPEKVTVWLLAAALLTCAAAASVQRQLSGKLEELGRPKFRVPVALRTGLLLLVAAILFAGCASKGGELSASSDFGEDGRFQGGHVSVSVPLGRGFAK